MTLPGWAREPLVHFIVAGGLLYALFAWTGGNAVDPSSRAIAVDRDQQALLAVQFERTMGRAPTDAELDVQVERFVRDEVLYREALRLGLDQGDAVVRRRLVSKMDMAAGAAVELAEPDEAVLRAYFKDNSVRYAGGELVDFEQLYFRSRAAARAAMERGPGERSGVPISLPAAMDGTTMREIEARFGEQFAHALGSLAARSQWQGPIQSGFGWHLVRVTDKRAANVDFESVREQVENDWRSAEIALRKDRAYTILRDAYRIDIER